GGEDVSGRLIELDVGMLRSERNGSVGLARGLDILHQDPALRSGGRGSGRRRTGVVAVVPARVGEGLRRRIVRVGVDGASIVKSRARRGGGWLIEILTREQRRGVIPGRQVNLDGRGAIFPLRGVHANGEPRWLSGRLHHRLDNFSGENGVL